MVVLAFWAIWSAPCRAELPLLSSYARHAGAGLRVLGFSLDTPETMREVHQVAQALQFPVGLLSDSSAPGYGRIWRLPVSFTIDRAGRLSSDGWKQRQPPGLPIGWRKSSRPSEGSPTERCVAVRPADLAGRRAAGAGVVLSRRLGQPCLSECLRVSATASARDCTPSLPGSPRCGARPSSSERTTVWRADDPPGHALSRQSAFY